MATIEIRKDKRGQFRFSMKSRNGETIATGESYKQTAKAMATARSLAAQLSKAKVVDLTQPPPTKSSSAKTAKTASKKAAKKSSGKAAPKAAKSSPTRPTSKAKVARPKAAPPAKAARPPASARPVAARRRGAEELSPREAEPIRTPAGGRSTSAGSRLVSRGDETRPTEADDELDTVAQAEGNDIVRPDQLGDGERIADGIEPEGDDDAAPADGGDSSGGGDDEGTVR